MSLSRSARVPPQSLEAEQSVLGSMLLERSAIDTACEILQPEDFYREAHTILFNACLGLSERGEPVDLTTIASELENRGQLEQIGGRPYIAALLDSVPTAFHAEYYAKIVSEKAILRRMITAATEVVEECFGEVESTDEVIDKAEQSVLAVTRRSTRKRPEVVTVGLDRVIAQIEASKNNPDARGIPSGLSALDKITYGFGKGDLIIVAARPSMGKTSLCVNLGVNAAITYEKSVAIFSLEMARDALLRRIIQAEAKVDGDRLKTGNLSDDDWRRVVEVRARMDGLSLFIDDESPMQPRQIASKARQLAASPAGLDLIVVDYLQKMHCPGHDSVNHEIGAVAEALKNLAKELDIPVIALSQLSRRVEQREDKRPMMSDLLESGKLEAEADMVLLLYRDSYYQRGKPDEDEEFGTELDETEIIVAKSRNGGVGTARTLFHKRYMCFEDAADPAYY